MATALQPFTGHLAEDGISVTIYTLGDSQVGIVMGRDGGRKSKRLQAAGAQWQRVVSADDRANLSLSGDWVADSDNPQQIEVIACGPDAARLLAVARGEIAA